MRKDAGLSTDVDRIPQLSWILFLKAFDDLERERSLLNPFYREALKKPYRWRDWAAEEEKGLRSKLKKKEAEIKALKSEVGELKDKYLRKLAEMENLRKRFDRERAEYEQYALSDFLRELLIVLDNFERALQNRDQSDGKSFLQGVEMIYRQYLDLLKKQGLRPIEITDKKFDPNIQQAVVTEESETAEEPEVAEELQRGYWLQERLLRPAMVKVIVPKKRET